MMGIVAFDTRKVFRPVLLPIGLYLSIIVISMMSIVKPSHAIGSVPQTSFTVSYSYVGLSPKWSISCLNYSSEAEVLSCYYSQWNATNPTQLLCSFPTILAKAVIIGGTLYTPGNGYFNVYKWAPSFGGCQPGNLEIAKFIYTNICPENSRGPTPGYGSATSTCACLPGYQPDPLGTSCVFPNSCPANMTGSPCTCNSGYVPNPYGAGCVEEQYTLSVLQDSQPDVEPGSSRDVIVQVTSKLTGNPKSGAGVSLRADVDDTSGGHAHGGIDRDKGTLSGAACDPPEKYCATATTDTNGYASFTFKAPAVSGEHTVTAACVNPSCSNTDTGKINVKVAGLIPISSEPSIYVLIGGEADKMHHDNHYLTESAMSQLIVLAINYHFLHLNETVLHLNDASLEWGGLFDKDGDWDIPHKKHRRGVVIDIRANTASGNIPERLFTDFKKLAKDTKLADDVTSAQAKIHCSRGRDYSIDKCIGDDNRHFHVVLLGVDQ